MDKNYKRMIELEEEAIGRFLDDTDFNRLEWMDDQEQKEYIKLYKKVNGECPQCGEIKCNH